MFYTWRQNNSGGSFTGPAGYVCIEAASTEVAKEIALGLGLYFDGGDDCPTCGDRWHEEPHEIAETPSIYGEPVAQAAANSLDPSWLIVYADGRREQDLSKTPKWARGR